MNLIKLIGKPLGTKSKRRIKSFILKNIYFDRLVATYDTWVIENFPDILDVLRQREDIKTFSYRPLISITVPTYNTPIDFLHECIRSVLAQSYENWELVLVDDASPNKDVREVIKDYANKDSRIKYKFLEKNHHIAGATNEAIKLSTGEYIGLFDHDDILWPNALYEVVKALIEHRDIDFLYTDEDKIVEKKSHHAEPFFKPDWSPVLLRTCNYITHFSVFRRELLDEVGYEDGRYNGAQDWEMILRATRSAKRIHHISKVLYSWRVHDNSTAKTMTSKPYVVEAQRAAIADDMRARGYRDIDYRIVQHSKYFAFWKTSIQTFGARKVSVIALDKKQINKIKKMTTYRYCEFVAAASYTEGLKLSNGDYVVFLEPGIRVASKHWVEILLNNAGQENVGVVGGLNLYKNSDYIYNAGISLNQDNRIVHVLSGGVSARNLKTLTRTMYVHARRNTAAVTGCMMVDRANVLGYKFDESISSTEQLISLAFYLLSRGMYNVYDPELVVILDRKYRETMRGGNRERRKTYSDEIIRLSLDSEKCQPARERCYFYDDLVSYPDVD